MSANSIVSAAKQISGDLGPELEEAFNRALAVVKGSEYLDSRSRNTLLEQAWSSVFDLLKQHQALPPTIGHQDPNTGRKKRKEQ